MNDERIPGITFQVLESQLTSSSTHKATGLVSLSADVDNLDMWDNIVEKFRGMRLYEADEVAGELVELLQDDIKQLQEKIDQLSNETNTTTETLKQQLSLVMRQNVLLNLENKRLMAQVSLTNEELESHRRFWATVEAVRT